MTCHMTLLPSSLVMAWSYLFTPMFSTRALNSHWQLRLLPALGRYLSSSSQTLPQSESACSMSTHCPSVTRFSFFTAIVNITHLKILDFRKPDGVETSKVSVFCSPLFGSFVDRLLTNTPKLEHQILQLFWQVCMWQFCSSILTGCLT